MSPPPNLYMTGTYTPIPSFCSNSNDGPSLLLFKGRGLRGPLIEQDRAEEKEERKGSNQMLGIMSQMSPSFTFWHTAPSSQDSKFVFQICNLCNLKCYHPAWGKQQCSLLPAPLLPGLTPDHSCLGALLRTRRKGSYCCWFIHLPNNH